MRTIRLAQLTIILLCLSSSLFSQTNIFGGFYLGGGIAQPQELSLETPTGTTDDGAYGFIGGTEGLGLKSGYFLELGGTGYFGDGWNQKRMRLGFDINIKTYLQSTSENSFQIQDVKYQTITKFKRLGFSGGSGLILTISPFKHFTIDVFGRIRVEYFGLPEFEIKSDNTLSSYSEIIVSRNKYKLETGGGYGFRLKYKKLMLAAEWNVLEDLLQSYDFIYDGIPAGGISFKHNKSFLDLSIGIYF